MSVVDASTEVSHVAARVAPEDLRTGDYVAVLSITREFPSFYWCSEMVSITPEVPIRIVFQDYLSGTPLKIKGICLPFVFLKQPGGNHCNMDVRQVQFVKLNSEFAQMVWKELK